MIIDLASDTWTAIQAHPEAAMSVFVAGLCFAGSFWGLVALLFWFVDRLRK